MQEAAPIPEVSSAPSVSRSFRNFWERTPVWVQRATPPAIVISLVLHAALVLIGAFVMVRGGYGSSSGSSAEGGGNGGAVEVAMMSGGEFSELESLAAASADQSLPAIPDVAVDAGLAPVDALETSPIGDLTGNDLGGGGESSGLHALSGGGELTGTGGIGLGGSGSGGGGASFFGIAASGTRFAYLVDSSGSMDGKRIVMLQEQLNKSIGGLAQNCQFMIIAFADQSQPLGNKKEWRDASDSGRVWARTEIDFLRAAGGTVPDGGLEMIFSMRPRPDAVYFMTDGEFNPAVIDQISKLNRRSKIPVHCICLGSEAGSDAMKQIAKQSGGTFKFIAE